MVDKYIKIGPFDDIVIYDDAEYPLAVETDGDISAANFLPSGGVSTTWTCLTQIQGGGAGLLGIQYKNRSITVLNGIITVVDAESAWVDI